jgi:hypothetical protein
VSHFSLQRVILKMYPVPVLRYSSDVLYHETRFHVILPRAGSG